MVVPEPARGPGGQGRSESASRASAAPVGRSKSLGVAPASPRGPTHAPPRRPVKHKQRLDHELLAEALRDRGLVPPKTLEHVLAQCVQSGALFTEQLVRDGVVSDWELAQLCCEKFGLAFMPVDLYEPDRELLALFDATLLRQNALVPLDRFGNVLVVAMPCMVPSEVLDEIEARLSVRVMPVVGSVRANVRYLEENLKVSESLAKVAQEADDGDWTNVLDMGDAAVQVELVGAEAEAALDDVERGIASEPASLDDLPPAGLELLDLDLDAPPAPLPNHERDPSER